MYNKDSIQEMNKNKIQMVQLIQVLEQKGPVRPVKDKKVDFEEGDIGLAGGRL